MSFFPTANLAQAYESIAWPPEPTLRMQAPSCFDFPKTTDAGFSIAIDAAMAEAHRIVGICKRPGDRIAAGQLAFWCQMVSDLEQLAQGGRTPDRSRQVSSLGGQIAEDLCWRHLQFSRRNDRRWSAVCRGVDRYFDMRSGADELVRRFRSAGGSDDDIWRRYCAASKATERYRECLDRERLRIMAEEAGPSASSSLRFIPSAPPSDR